MIPQKLREFLERPVLMAAASRDRGLQPYAIRGFGPVRVDSGGVVGFYVSRRHAARWVDDGSASWRVALVACDVTNFETYQFKGRFVSHRDADEDDHRAVDRYLREAQAAVVAIGFPEESRQWALWDCKPCVAIRFEVDAVFHQTPGPGTGNRLDGE